MDFFRVKFAGSQADRVLKAEAEAKKLSEQLNKMEISGSYFIFGCDCPV